MKIITTVGTSLLEKLEVSLKDMDKEYFKYKERKKREIKKYIENIEKRLSEFNSAEIDTIKKIIEKYDNEIFEVVLIATDTLKGYIVAELLKKYFEKNNFDGKILKVDFSEKNVIEGLNVDNGDVFVKEGLLNLFNFLKQFSGENFQEKKVVFNISGGYKGVIPFLTIIAQTYKIPLYYTYEKSDVLIHIPQLPLSINWSVFIKYRDVIEKLKEGFELYKSFDSFKMEKGYWDFPDIVEEIKVDDKYFVSLNAVGLWLFDEFKEYFIVEVVKSSKFYNENKGNKKEIEEVLLELRERLLNRINSEGIKNTKELIEFLINKVDDKDDLKHGGNLSNNSFIFKSTNKSQIRILYSPMLKNGELIIKLIDYKRGNFNHSTYIDEFRKLMKDKTNQELEDIEILAIRRKNV